MRKDTSSFLVIYHTSHCCYFNPAWIHFHRHPLEWKLLHRTWFLVPWIGRATCAYLPYAFVCWRHELFAGVRQYFCGTRVQISEGSDIGERVGLWSAFLILWFGGVNDGLDFVWVDKTGNIGVGHGGPRDFLAGIAVDREASHVSTGCQFKSLAADVFLVDSKEFWTTNGISGTSSIGCPRAITKAGIAVVVAWYGIDHSSDSSNNGFLLHCSTFVENSDLDNNVNLFTRHDSGRTTDVATTQKTYADALRHGVLSRALARNFWSNWSNQTLWLASSIAIWIRQH